MKTRKLLTVVVASIAFAVTAFAQTVPSYVPTDGLVGYWGFNGNANDESVNGNNGTVHGATLTADRNGNANSAYSFNGNSNYISIPYSTSIGVQQSLSVSFWVYMDGGSCGPRILQSQPWGQCGGYYISTNSTSNVSRTFSGSIDNCNVAVGGSSSTPLDALSWHQVTFIASGLTGKCQFYYDGILINSVNTDNFFATIDYNNHTLIIGNIDPNSCDWFGGYLDDIAIYNRALTQEEITQLYTGTTQAPAAIQSFTVNPDTTGHEGSTYAWSISPAAPSAVITGDGTNSISIAWGYTPAGNYLVQSVETNSADCIAEPVNTFVIVSDSGLAPATLTVVSPVNYCKGATAAPLTATASENSTLIWYATATTKTALTSAPTPLTTAASTKTFYVSEKNPEGVESERIPIEVIVSDLPKTPAALTLTSPDETPRFAGVDDLLGLNTLAKITKIGPYIGTDIGFTLTASASALANHYRWELPEGVYSPDLDGDNNSKSPVITVTFIEVTPGEITPLTINVYAVNDCGESPLKALTLARTLPKAPSTLVLTSADDSPRIPVVDGLLALNTLTKITKVGPYVGTDIEFTLTAAYTAAPAQGVEATKYHWELPEGVGSADLDEDNNSEGPVIQVNFADVTPGEITPLTINVSAVNGNGTSVVKTLVLQRALPKAPSKLVLTNTTEDNLSSLLKITKVGSYIGTAIEFTLTAAYTLPAAQGVEATKYNWELPEGVGSADLDEDNNSKGPVIQVNFADVTPGEITPLTINVFAVNGNGTSVVKTLVLQRALPKAPSKLVLTDGESTAAITTVSNYIGTDTELTLTATAVTAQGAEAAKYHWVLADGVSSADLDEEGNSEEPVITVNFAGVASGVTALPISVFAVNGNGTSTAKILALRSAKPSTPGTITGALNFNPSCSDAIIVEVPNVDGVSYTWSVNGTEAAVTSEDNLNAAIIDVSKVTTATLTISVIATNGAGSSAAKTLVIPKVDTCDSITPMMSKVIPEVFKVVAYPNPSSEGFTIKSSNEKSFGVQVYDMAGRLIEKLQIKSGPTQLGANYPSGTYILKVSQGKNLKSLQLIKR